MTHKLQPYNPEFIEKCFVIWYGQERRPSTYYGMAQIMPEDEFGRKPGISTVKKWYLNGWEARASELDSKAIEIVETTLITKKAALLQKQAEDAFLLSQKAHEFLISGTFDSSAAAVNAYFKATEEVRIVIGISDFLKRLGKMTDDEVQDEIRKRFIRLSEAGQTLEGEEVEEDIGGDSHEETS